jgi:hypothetical protein
MPQLSGCRKTLCGGFFVTYFARCIPRGFARAGRPSSIAASLVPVARSGPQGGDHDRRAVGLSMAIAFSPLAATNFPTGGHEFPHQRIDWFVVC